MREDFKVFRDPIHDLISFDKQEEKVLLDIINTPTFQRLRRIKQLGFSEYTYPTATHNRFSHSIGVSHLIGKFFDNLGYVPEKVKFKVVVDEEEKEVNLGKDELKLILKIVGLLHDIGHGPFSHAFERLMKEGFSHETMTIRIIENTEIRSHIEEYFGEDGKFIVKLITDIIEGKISSEHYWVKEIISSQLDADRMDYLLRDAYMCGVSYASFEPDWLIMHMEVNEIPQENNRLGIVINAKKGLHSVESFIISRYHMYERVYFHKTTRAFESVLVKLFERLKELKDEWEDLFVDDYLIRFVENPEKNLEYFYFLDDAYMVSYFNRWIQCKDEILSKLSQALVYRIPPKLRKEISFENHDELQEYHELIKNLEGNRGTYFFYVDNYKLVAYKDPYLLGEKSAERAEHIWVKYRNQIQDLAEVSHLVKGLRNKTLRRTRVYEYREEIA